MFHKLVQLEILSFSIGFRLKINVGATLIKFVLSLNKLSSIRWFERPFCNGNVAIITWTVLTLPTPTFSRRSISLETLTVGNLDAIHPKFNHTVLVFTSGSIAIFSIA